MYKCKNDVKTVPGIRGGGMKKNSEGMNSTMIYLKHCKNICKSFNIPPPSTTIKINK
jgi:hypothetical protein